MSKAKILIADDHLIVAEALLSCLKGSFDVMGIVANGAELVERIRKQRPQLVVSDIGMPKMGGMEALRKLRSEGLDTKVIFLTMHGDVILVREAILAGASGYVLKDAAVEELVTAITQVLAGNIYLSSRIAREVMSDGSSRPGSRAEKITPRQREVLQLVVTGLTMKEVAAQLNLSRRTVETHKYDLMETLGVHSTTELVHYAIRHHLVDECTCMN